MSDAEMPVAHAAPPIVLTDDAAAAEVRAFDALHEELDEWQRQGRHCPLWWRDDDLIADSPALHTMAEMAERNGVPVMVAVIPALAHGNLAKDTAAMSLLSFCQHGLHHRNNEPVGAPSSEFGGSRPADALAADLREGRDRMGALFGERFLPVFVPPWNRMRADAMPILKELGMRGASLYHGQTAGFGKVLPVINAHVDILLWTPRPPTQCRPTQALIERLVTLLRNSRATAEPATPLGILTHHRPMLDDAWTFMQRLFDASKAHGCVRWLSPSELFPA